MSLTAIGGMERVAIGFAGRQGYPSLAALSSVLIDAAKEAIIMIAQIDWVGVGGTHTVDTTGSSALEFRTVAVTNSNASTRIKVGLATLDTATGPPPRATNSTDTITFSVSKTHSGGGGTITANAWQTNVPDAGTLAIAQGGYVAFCVQMTVLGGTDLINVGSVNSIFSGNMPSVTSFTGGAYAAAGRLPDFVITASDGTVGFPYGGFVASVGATTQTWNSGSAQVEYGNFIQFPVPVTAYGIVTSAGIGGDTDFVLYSDPAGTPVALATTSLDANTVAASTNGQSEELLFATPVALAANTLYFVSAKPGATNISLNYKSYNAAAHQASDLLGANCYAGSRASGAFAAQNSNKDRFAIGLLVGAFDNGANIGPFPNKTIFMPRTR